MKHIIKKLALLFVPVYLWFAFFVAFEPNNYFGIKKTASSSQPVRSEEHTSPFLWRLSQTTYSALRCLALARATSAGLFLQAKLRR